ncbi:MAG: helix-turn-helix domain-containing protein [Streptosporangiaceae bacterium]
MPSAKRLDPSASALAFFGAELRRLRSAAGVSQEQLGEKVNYSADLISKIETAERMPKLDLAQRCDQTLGTDGFFARLSELVRREATPAAWFADYLDLEAEASQIHTYESHVVPGLLQTEDYARAVVEAARPRLTPEEVASRATLRMTRQEALLSDDPPRVWAIADEAVLFREVGGGKVMREQFQALLGFAEKPAVTVQVLPLTEGAGPAMGKFIILKFPDDPDVVYLEELTTSLYLRDNIDEVTRYGMIFEHLRATALPERKSLALIADRAKEWA